MTKQFLEFIRGHNAVIIRNGGDWWKFAQAVQPLPFETKFRQTYAEIIDLAKYNPRLTANWDGHTIYIEFQPNKEMMNFAYYPNDRSVEDWYGVETLIEAKDLLD